MPTAYPEVLRNVLTSVEQLKLARIAIDDLKAALWEASRVISSHEERELRQYFQWAEGKLDMIQSTVSSEDAFPEALKIAQGVEDQVNRALG
jgi:hypothetical protein